MAFNRNDPAHLLALKNEVNNDPLGIGYLSSGSTQQLLNGLNDPDNNPDIAATIAEVLTVRRLLDSIDPGDLTVGGQFTQGELEWLKMVIESAASQDDNIDSIKAKITALFANNSATKVALDSFVRKLSRAEVLFGAETIISRDDWFAARDSI